MATTPQETLQRGMQEADPRLISGSLLRGADPFLPSPPAPSQDQEQDTTPVSPIQQIPGTFMNNMGYPYMNGMGMGMMGPYGRPYGRPYGALGGRGGVQGVNPYVMGGMMGMMPPRILPSDAPPDPKVLKLLESIGQMLQFLPGSQADMQALDGMNFDVKGIAGFLDQLKEIGQEGEARMNAMFVEPLAKWAMSGTSTSAQKNIGLLQNVIDESPAMEARRNAFGPGEEGAFNQKNQEAYNNGAEAARQYAEHWKNAPSPSLNQSVQALPETHFQIESANTPSVRVPNIPDYNLAAQVQSGYSNSSLRNLLAGQRSKNGWDPNDPNDIPLYPGPKRDEPLPASPPNDYGMG